MPHTRDIPVNIITYPNHNDAIFVNSNHDCINYYRYLFLLAFPFQ